jgi:aminoglycoside phosphotransferase (APT) family kinase protein
LPTIDKQNPQLEWIESLRARFPCEAEVDRVLTRKMKRRSGPAYAPVSLETLTEGARQLIASQIDAPFQISEANWLSGGASKLQMRFKLAWNKTGAGETVTDMVLRMEPSESISETSRKGEFETIKALDGIIPVPPTYWVDHDASFLPYPAIIYGFAEGVTKPSKSTSNVTGVGTFFPPEMRAALGGQLIEHCATLHAFDWRTAALETYDVPKGPYQAVEWQLNHWERVWEEDSNEDVPLMRLAMAWLRKNMPPVDTLSIIHGDFRAGNFLFTEDDLKISVWLDWEFGHLGDRHEDISWTVQPVFGQTAEDGKTLLVGGLTPLDEFYRLYEKASGLTVDPERMRYYGILNSYKAIAITLATGTRTARGSKTHQDILVAWLSGISYMLLDKLTTQLEEVL